MKISVGFELEAGVKDRDKARETARNLQWTTGRDSSIHTRGNSYPLEFKSKVYTMKKDYKRMIADFKKITKTVNEINSSMGLHIHVSFSDKITYCRLCSYKFVKKFQTSYKKKFTKMKEKRRPTNSFCKFYPNESRFDAEILSQLKNGSHKFRSLNFGAISYHRTFEFRIFPATKDVKEFKRYMDFVIKLITSYLKKNKKDDIEPEIKRVIYKYNLKRR